MPRRERRRDQRLTRKAVSLWSAGLSPSEIADSLHTSEEAVEKLLRPLSGAGHLREDESKRRKADMTSNEPIRTFTKKLPSLGPDAPDVAFTEMSDGTFVVDFEEAHEAPVRALAERNGYGDLVSADLPYVWSEAVNLTEQDATADLALQPGSYVEWSYDSGQTTSYGQIVSLDPEGGVAVISPLELDSNGDLVAVGRRKVTVALGLLQPTNKAPATPTAWPNQTKQVSPDDTSNMSDADLLKTWRDFSGLGNDADAADLVEDMPAEDVAQTQVAEAADLRDTLRRQSAERDPGPDIETEEKSRGLLAAWRRLFRGEEG